MQGVTEKNKTNRTASHNEREKTRGPEAEQLTYFTYYEIDAFRQAAEECGLSRADICKVFYENAVKLLS